MQPVGAAPFTSLVVDFTEMPRDAGYRYLLVFVCTMSGWIEAFPTKTEKSGEVVKALLKDHLPRYGLLTAFRSDNGPAFIEKTLGTVWKFHAVYRLQSSGKVE